MSESEESSGRGNFWGWFSLGIVLKAGLLWKLLLHSDDMVHAGVAVARSGDDVYASTRHLGDAGQELVGLLPEGQSSSAYVFRRDRLAAVSQEESELRDSLENVWVHSTKKELTGRDILLGQLIIDQHSTCLRRLRHQSLLDSSHQEELKNCPNYNRQFDSLVGRST